jgi:hypothetical protein
MLTAAQIAELDRVITDTRAYYSLQCDDKPAIYPAFEGMDEKGVTRFYPAAWAFHPMDYLCDWVDWSLFSTPAEQSEADAYARARLSDLFSPNRD